MPSSLTRVFSRALGFSPHLPVSVCGTGTLYLDSSFSWQPGISDFGTIFPSYSYLRLHDWRICLPITLLTSTPHQLGALPILLRHYFSQSISGGTGISTSFPSTTPFGLALGPDLPWADEPSPGILRFSAGRILTCLFAYLYLHSHFLTLQHSFRYAFSVLRTLLYQHLSMLRSFGK